MIDGFVKASGSTSSNNGQSAKMLHQRAEKAQTLMRGALKKPAAGLNSTVQKLTPGINYQREARAQKISKHSLIDRFGGQRPASQPALQGEIVNRPAPVPAKPTAPVMPSMVTSVSHQKLERLLDEALVKADSHKAALKFQAARHFWQKPGFLGRHRGIKLGVAVLIILGAGLFTAWQKFPQLSVKVAAIRAHMAASVPTYKPDGYQMAAPATTQAGAVILKYKDVGGSGGFDLSQQPSDLTSSNIAQAVVPKNTPVQTSNVNGNTVYIYGASNNAAWVNNGVLYTIKDRSKLSPDQINKIVESL